MGRDEQSWLRKTWRKLCSCQTAEVRIDSETQTESDGPAPKPYVVASKVTPTTTSTSIATLRDQDEIQRTHSQLQLQEGTKQFAPETVEVPELQYPGEVLVEIKAVGLNPIDWKSVAYGFGIPKWPFVSGREFVGTIVRKYTYDEQSDAKVGDLVLVVSTDYRDYRKAAFQQYAVAWDYNTLRIPAQVQPERVAGIGVAFVAAALSLGICLGATFPDNEGETGLDLLLLARAQPKHSIPEDVRPEVFGGVQREDRIRSGDWLVVYGASAITGQMAVQLAKLAGINVIAVANADKHGDRLRAVGADLVVDRADLDAAIQHITKVTKGELRYAMDTVDKKTAEWSHKLLHHNATKRVGSGVGGDGTCHLVGLSGVPKELESTVRAHALPIKLFHTNAVLGRAVMLWLEELLATGRLKLPEVDVMDGGLEKVNDGLERLKSGEASGKRIVVSL